MRQLKRLSAQVSCARGGLPDDPPRRDVLLELRDPVDRRPHLGNVIVSVVGTSGCWSLLHLLGVEGGGEQVPILDERRCAEGDLMVSGLGAVLREALRFVDAWVAAPFSSSIGSVPTRRRLVIVEDVDTFYDDVSVEVSLLPGDDSAEVGKILRACVRDAQGKFLGSESSVSANVGVQVEAQGVSAEVPAEVEVVPLGVYAEDNARVLVGLVTDGIAGELPGRSWSAEFSAWDGHVRLRVDGGPP